MLTSVGIHLAVLALVLLAPAEVQGRVRPREVDVVFRKPPPVAVTPPPAPLPPARGLSARKPKPVQLQEPSPIVAPEPKSAAPGDPQTTVAEAPPEPKAGKAGILAFKDKLASLASDRTAPRLGKDARYTTAENSNQSSSPSILTSNSPGSSRGLDAVALTRKVGGGGGGAGGGGGNGIDGVGIDRATSSIAGIGGGDRPLSHGGPGPARTDEEIQIVFDRYKAQFYRMYNRELRKDPTLKGQMVLRLTIEPDGSVSMCKLQSSDMNAPDLGTQVVNIVLTINFGAKEGVQALTISYPIDFLPAS